MSILDEKFFKDIKDIKNIKDIKDKINNNYIEEGIIITQEIIDKLLFLGLDIENFITYNFHINKNQNLSIFFKDKKGYCSLFEAIFVVKDDIEYGDCLFWLNHFKNEYGLEDLIKIINHFNNKKDIDYLFNDFKEVINNTKIFEYLFFQLIEKNNNLITIDIFEKLIILGSNINKELLNIDILENKLNNKLYKVIEALGDIDEEDCSYNQYEFYKNLKEDLFYDHIIHLDEQKKLLYEIIKNN